MKVIVKVLSVSFAILAIVAGCKAKEIIKYNEGFSFQTRDEFPDDPNALTIFNEIKY